MKLFPSKEQFKKWSIPSKASLIGLYVGLFAIILSILFYFKPNSPSNYVNAPANNSTTILKIDTLNVKEDKSESNLKLVDISFIDSSQKTKQTVLDIKLRNTGDKVAYLKKTILYVKKIWQLKPYYDIPLSYKSVSYNYDINLILNHFPYTIEKILSQEIKPNEADRFTFTLGNDSLSIHYMEKDLIFLMKIVLIYDEDNKKIISNNLLFSPGCKLIDNLYSHKKYQLPEYFNKTIIANQKVISDLTSIIAIKDDRIEKLISYYREYFSNN